MRYFRRLMRSHRLRGYYNRFINRDAADILVLSSIPKSGVTYLRYIITNYLRLLDDERAESVTYQTMHEILFPNRKQFFPPLRYKPPSSLMKHLRYRDIYNTHVGSEYLRYSKADLLFLYRNPLDNLVSQYFYFYKYRSDRGQNVSAPRDIIGIELPKFIAQFNDMMAACRLKRALPISYESLMRAPFETSYLILTWMDAPIDAGRLRKALAMSDFKAIRKEEETKGPVGSPKDGLQGFFTRSGAIGQWREHFDADDLQRISKMLDDHGLPLKRFVLE